MTTTARATLALTLGAIAVALAGVAAKPTFGQTVAERQPLSASAAAGANLFRTYCAACHGATGIGDGPLAAAMSPKPKDLTGLLKRNDGVYPGNLTYRIIDGRTRVPGHGGRDMPVWGDAFLKSSQSDNEAAVKVRIQALVDYLETLQARAGQ